MGWKGLEKAIAWAPAIVVTDLKMPRMDGMELLSRIGELPQRIAVVMLTAQGSIESAVEAMRMGAYDYIPKPVDPVRLKTILHNASRQREADVELEATRRQLRDTGVLGTAGGILAADEGHFYADRAGGAVECVGAGDGRERNGQGAGGAGAA